VHELLDEGDMRIEIIPDHAERHLWMFLPQARDEPLACRQLTALRRTLHCDIAHRFHIKREDLMRARTHHRGADDLVGIVHPPLRISLAQTMWTLNLG
jgi:hypothetical protein